MTPTKKEDTTVQDLISICSKLIEVFTASMAQNAEMLKVLREQNEILRKSNERMETFLFMGDPAKNVPSFVSESRDANEENRNFRGVVTRITWIVVTFFILGGLGTLVWFRPVP